MMDSCTCAVSPRDMSDTLLLRHNREFWALLNVGVDPQCIIMIEICLT